MNKECTWSVKIKPWLKNMILLMYIAKHKRVPTRQVATCWVLSYLNSIPGYFLLLKIIGVNSFQGI